MSIEISKNISGFLPIEQKEKGNKGLCYEKEMNKLKDQKWKPPRFLFKLMAMKWEFEKQLMCWRIYEEMH